jgi:hypothetical protein
MKTNIKEKYQSLHSYVEPKQKAKVQKAARKRKVTDSRIIRELIDGMEG